MYYELVTGPKSEPVSLDEAKRHCRIDDDDTSNDIYLLSLIKVARKYIEKITNYVSVTSDWAAYADDFPGDERIYLLKCPVTSITKVEYFATDDATEYTELSTTKYETAVKYNPPLVRIKETPTIGDKINAVKIFFSAGHANTVDDPVPDVLKQAILVLILSLYENRQEEVTGTSINKFTVGFEYLMEQIRLLTP